MKWSYLVCAGLIGFQLQAKPLSEMEFEQLQSSIDAESIMMASSPESLLQVLQGMSSDAKTLAKALWLNQAAELSAPTQMQRDWVEFLVDSQEQLRVANLDHPNAPLVVVNVSNQAKATLRHWDINAAAEAFQQQWVAGNMDWQQALTGDWTQQQALLRWISQLPALQLERLVAHYTQYGMNVEVGDNRILARLAETSASPVLLARLWQRPADEHSHQVLQKLPNLLQEQAVVNQLSEAIDNPALQSQVLMGVAKHYHANAKAQELFMSALTNPKTQWYAAAAVREIKDPSFRRKLEVHLKSEQGAAAKMAMSQLQGAGQ